MGNIMTIKTKKIAIKQRGAALIAVLIILVVITLLGVTAMRMGLTSLTLATNSQVSQLLFQSADMGTASLVKLVQQDTASAMKVGGVIGTTTGSEQNLCVTPVNTANYGNTLSNGKCDVSQATSFLSARKLVATQVSYTRALVSDGESNSSEDNISQIGQGAAALAEERLKIYSTSVMPAFGSASVGDINDCLSKPSDDDEESNKNTYTKTDCLTDKGAVFTTHVSEFRITR